MDGFTILTDPVFSRRCGIDLGVATLGPKRLVSPALTVEELPKIDLVLLSHAHFDHWDMPSLAAVASKDIPVICAKETSDLLTPARWKSVEEMAWRDRKRFGPVEITGVEVKHWGARVRRDTHRGYTGYLLESASGRILFSGDTAFTDKFKELRSSRDIDLAIMPIGAYNPWIASHCTPEQAVQMADWAGARQILPVHHKTFVLSNEPVEEPLERFLAKSDRGVATEIGMEWARA
jgi:L-ascorbate metabolism protein UlaG (beta-lactamase superfamily)